MILLLDTYRSQLIQAAEFMKAKGQAVPEVIIRAIKCLSKVLGEDWGWGGAVAPDEPDHNGPSSNGIPILLRGSGPATVGRSLVYRFSPTIGGDDAGAERLIELERTRLLKGKPQAVDPACHRTSLTTTGNDIHFIKAYVHLHTLH